MPLYEYRCKACGEEFDKIVSSKTLDSEIVCPSCGQRKAERRLSLFSFGSRTSSGEFTSSSSGCAGCTSTNCSSCKN